MNILGLLILLLLFCLCVWAARSILKAFGIGDPMATLVQVVVVIIFVLLLLQNLGYVGGPTLRLR